MLHFVAVTNPYRKSFGRFCLKWRNSEEGKSGGNVLGRIGGDGFYFKTKHISSLSVHCCLNLHAV
jgi:hypothetical protein